MHVSRMFLVIVAGACGLVRADVVTRRWGPRAAPQSVQATTSSEPSVTSARVDLLAGQQGWVLEFDLSDLPAGAKIYRADVILARCGPLLGSEDDAMVKVEVYPVSSSSAEEIVPLGRPLALRSPWFDRLDATDAVQQWDSGKRHGSVLAVVTADAYGNIRKWIRENPTVELPYQLGRQQASP